MSLFDMVRFRKDYIDEKDTFSSAIEKHKAQFMETFSALEEQRKELNEANVATLYGDLSKIIAYTGKYHPNPMFRLRICEDEEVIKAWNNFIGLLNNYVAKEIKGIDDKEDSIVAASEEYAKNFALLKTFMHIKNENNDKIGE